MKKITLILLILVVLVQGFSKVGWVAFYNFNKDYISQNLCENKEKVELQCEGKCYLKKQLDEDEKQQSAPAGDSKDKHETFWSFYPGFNISYPEIFVLKHNIYTLSGQTTGYFISFYHPPQI